MKVSYNWLQEYFEEELPSPDEVGELLTFHSFELEEIEQVGDGHIIEVDILPNRSSDCLSHRGIAKELATLLDRDMKLDPLAGDNLEIDESEELEVEIANKDLCDRFAGTVIKGVQIGPSPEWLKTKLEALGQRSISNVVDATNYVMLNTGQPLHAFDFDKLEGEKKNITVRLAEEGEKISLLAEDSERELDAETLVITDGNSKAPIAIAGVKGGKPAEVDDNTTNIILEAAHFNFTSVRKTSQRIKLWTDASTRFQNNPSAHLPGFAMADVVELILDIAGGEVEGGVDLHDEISENPQVNASVSQINALLGTSLESKEIEDIFERLDFDYEVEGENFVVTAPFERTDINILEDVIEEVGRINGYEKLEAKLLPDVGLKAEVHKDFYIADRIRNILNELGWDEIYGYAFRNNGHFEAVHNLASDKAFLRTNLSDGMGEYLEMNAKNAPLFGQDRIRIFEIGNVFPKDGEHLSLCLGVSGKKTEKILTEALEKLESELGAPSGAKVSGNTLEISLSNWIAKLEVGDSYDPYEKNETVYKQFSLYPFVLRDIAAWVPSETGEEDIVSLIKEKGSDLLRRVDRFDRFEKDGKVSYAFHLVFQSESKTLSDEEVNAVMTEIETAFTGKGYDVR